MDEFYTAEVLNYLVYAGSFLGVLLVFTGLIQLAQRGETRGEARSRRMQMIQKGADIESILAILKPRRETGVMARIPALRNLPETLAQAGMTVSAKRFLMFCALLAVAVFVAATQFIPLPGAAGAAVLIGFVIPLLVVKSRRDERMKKLVQQLPDALELMARGLRIGHPLNTSIGAVAEEMPDPIGTEFGLVFDQISFGDDLPDAMQEFADRVGLEDAQYLAASISIQHGTGGELARVIRVLAKVIRDRLTLRRKIKAITSEGRLTAWFLSALPLLILGATQITSPTYYGGVRDDPMFIPLMLSIAVLTLLNFLVLRKLVNFRV